MKALLRASALTLIALASPAAAQVYDYRGPSPNIAGPALDFDAAGIVPGPVTPALYAGTGVVSIEPFGTGWGTNGTWTYLGVFDQVLGLSGGVPTIMGALDSMDRAAFHDGWEIALGAPVDELQIRFSNTSNFFHEVELFHGPASLGTGDFGLTSQASLRYFRAAAGPFDRARITIVGTSAVGFDTIGIGFGPPPPPPGNDECASATLVVQGNHWFTTRSGTASAEPLQCATSTPGSADVWLAYDAVTTGFNLEICLELVDYYSHCELYLGTCGALTPVACGQGSCGTFSLTDPGVVAGERYWLRLGGRSDSRGRGRVKITEHNPAAPTSPNCIQTYFAAQNTTSEGGAVFFDMDALDALLIPGLALNTSTTGPIGLEVYGIPGSYVGNTSNPGGAGWTLLAVDDGLAAGQGAGQETPVNFMAPWSLPAGNWGIALVGRNTQSGATLAHAFSPGTPLNQAYSSGDGLVDLSAGAAADIPWGAALTEPAVWNGRFCYARQTLGTNYCTAVLNSTGLSGEILAGGSLSVSANDLTLRGEQLPPNAFGFFLTSLVQGFSPQPGGSAGNLCLGGHIGRYIGPGQIQNSGADGRLSLAIDWTQVPQPTGFVAARPGETWNFTLWYRDFASSAISNFTNGIALLLE